MVQISRSITEVHTWTTWRPKIIWSSQYMEKKHILTNSTSISVKNSQQNGYWRNIPHNYSPIYGRPTTNFIFNGKKKLKDFPLRLGIRQRYPTWLILFRIAWKVLPTAIRRGKQIKYIQSRKEEIKLLLFVDDYFLCVGNLKDSTKTLLELMWIKSQDTELAYRNQLCYYTVIIIRNNS